MSKGIFGTCGIRRVFSNYDNRGIKFTPRMSLDVGLALGTYLQRNKGPEISNGITIVIGKDIRTAALPIEYALISGLVSAGCTVKTLGIVTTPTLAMSLNYLEANAGVMITASHNTPEYIGLKFWNRDGLGFVPEQEEEIERIYNEKDFIKTEWNDVGKVTHVNDINDIHIEDITRRIMFNGSSLNVIVDPGNGSACDIVPKLLVEYGCNIVTLNANMSGSFPGRLSEPNKENLQQISKFLRTSQKKDIGIALDGDADRVIFLDEKGEIVDPIRLLALMAKYYLEKYRGTKVTKENNKLVTPINSSSLVEDVLNPLGCEIIRCEVGDIKVALELKEHNGFLGGENSGTYIWPRTHYGPDSIVTIAKILQMIVETGKTLKELLRDIPEYPFYRQNFELKRDIPFTEQIEDEIIAEMKKVFREEGLKLKNINRLDGCRFDYEEGWILIRRSGTSPYLRISGESNESMEESKRINQLATKRMRDLDLI